MEDIKTIVTKEQIVWRGNVVTQEELNSRIVEDSDKILLIFKDYRRLNLYRRNFGRDSRKILLTDYDLENKGLVGLRYYNWHYVDDVELNNMINELYARTRRGRE